jgi:16S rRNA G966 N2-methylase RsmD
MPKRQPTTHQPTLYHKPVPTMPEGYYSAGPNPNLGQFVAEHATPYDPATDTYNVPPFDKPITTTKATAIYNMHTYWSKKPHDAIRQYIRHYTQPGDLVLDPFCGSGGTALAALMEGRAAIAIDLSPAATFITKNYCTPVDVGELERAFAELERKVKPEMEWLYETRCDRCDGRALTSYTVYSQVFRCERCLRVTPLFDCVEVASTTLAGKPKTISACPHCHAQGVVEAISTRHNEKLGAVPVLVSYECQEGCKPKRGERRHNDENEKKRRVFEEHDLGKLAEIDARPIPYWTPPQRMMNVASDTEPWGDEWRPGRNFRTVAELFTKRNLWALAAISHYAPASQCGETLRFTLSAIMLNCSKMYQYRPSLKGGFQKGTYYIPQDSQIINVWRAFSDKVDDLLRSVTVLPSDAAALAISTHSSTSQAPIPDNSVDYIFTDPPYGDSIQYGELNFVWEAWLGFRTDWHSEEIVVNETRGKSDLHWAKMMSQSMQECFRILKPGRRISLCYHDTSEGTWQLLQDVMAEAGFIPEEIDTALYIDTGQKSINQLTADKVTKRDLVINFRKPRPGESGAVVLTGDEDAATFTDKARAILVEALEAHPGSTADRLYDTLVSRMVRRGEFERHNFQALLEAIAEPVAEPLMHDLFTPKSPDLFGQNEQVRWYLHATAGDLDDAERSREDAAAARLELLMHRRVDYQLAENGEEGVHYSDLFEHYLPVKEKPRRLLQEWLPEYFYQTAAGAWRPPLTGEERAQKQALRASGSLRRIKRFVHALEAGVPPAARDLPASLADAADWLRQCRRAGLYAYGRALYERGGFDFASLHAEAQAEVEGDYQICVRRS